MATFDKFARLAHKLIDKYGYQKAVLMRQVKLNTEDFWNSEFELKPEKIKICILPSQKYSRETYRVEGDKTMADSNYVGYMPHYGFVPTINDKITVKDNEFSVVRVIEIAPNGEKIMFKLELK